MGKLKPPKRWVCILKRIPMNQKVIGAEIGVLYGQTAMKLLENRPNLLHIMVDPWSADNKDESYIDSGAHDGVADQAFFDHAYKTTMKNIRPFLKRTKIFRMKSLEAAKMIKDFSLDYVFIDGDHSYDGVHRDIEAWKSKVKPGGWIGGHDYKSPRFAGVVCAVHEFFQEGDISHEDDKTWFVRKK